MHVTRIASSAFENCMAFKIILPSTVEYIEPLAFDNCIYLESMDFPDNIKHIAPYAFKDCHNIGNVVINCPDVKIFDNSFYNCNIKALSINAKSVPYFRKYTTINQFTMLSEVKETDVNYLADSTKIPESVKIISGYINSNNYADITVLKHIEILGAFDDIQPIFMGSCIDLYPKVPLLDEEYGISANNISGYYDIEAHSYALTHGIRFTPLDDILYGDSNNDGKINIADAVLLQHYLLGNSEIPENADLNKDGCIDVFDMVMIRRMLVE